MSRRLCAVILGVVFPALMASCSAPPKHADSRETLAVLGAFDQEVTLIEEMLTDARVERIEGITLMSGRLAGRRVVVAWTGVGKVNAAMTATLLIEHFKPAQVIFTGIAGAVDPNLEPGDIVIGERTAHHDMGTLGLEGLEPGGVQNRLTGEANPVYFPADPRLLAAAREAVSQTKLDSVSSSAGRRRPKAIVGTIVTGDVFVASKERSSELRARFDADAVEMEGAAVAQVCYQRGIGCLVIRSMSDKADENAVADKEMFYATAARNSAALVARIIDALAIARTPDRGLPGQGTVIPRGQND
jgi:adenosylhomocysteine nucleosidase